MTTKLRAIVFCSRDETVLFRSEALPILEFASIWQQFIQFLPEKIKQPYCPECARTRGEAYAARFRNRNIRVTLIDADNPAIQYKPSELAEMVIKTYG